VSSDRHCRAAVTAYVGLNVPCPVRSTPGIQLSLVVMVAVAGVLYVSFKRRYWL